MSCPARTAFSSSPRSFAWSPARALSGASAGGSEPADGGRRQRPDRLHAVGQARALQARHAAPAGGPQARRRRRFDLRRAGPVRPLSGGAERGQLRQARHHLGRGADVRRRHRQADGGGDGPRLLPRDGYPRRVDPGRAGGRRPHRPGCRSGEGCRPGPERPAAQGQPPDPARDRAGAGGRPAWRSRTWKTRSESVCSPRSAGSSPGTTISRGSPLASSSPTATGSVATAGIRGSSGVRSRSIPEACACGKHPKAHP